MGRIGFENLTLSCVIGVYEHERKKPQEIIIDLAVAKDFEKAAMSGSVLDTVDYDKLVDVAKKIAKKKPRLLETFAYELIEAVIEEFSVEWASVKIRKPHALAGSALAFVELEKWTVKK